MATSPTYNTHEDMAEALILLITVHKISNPNCEKNCFDEILREIEKKAK